MKNLISALLGGVVVMAAATAIGVAQNALRERPIRLIPSASVPAPAATNAPAPGSAESAAGESGTAAQQPGELDAAALRARIDAGNVSILDARAPDAFAEGHIPGAINIPYDQLPRYLDTLQSLVMPEDDVVAYCWGPGCDFSDQLATELRMMGYTRVSVFKGGWEDWTEAGYPVESGGDQ